MNKSEVASGLNQLFNHRKQVIILGLTGRTGSGCTTLAKILENDKFENLDLPQPKVQPNDHEERKYRILHDWISVNWKPFKRISVSDLIAGFVAKEGFESFRAFIKELGTKNSDLLKLNPEYFDDIKSDIDKICEKCNSSELWNISSLSKPENFDSELELATQLIPEFAMKFREKLMLAGPDIDSLFFQTIGDNIRRSGNPYDKTVSPNKLFSIPQILDRLIEYYQIQNQSLSEPTYIVIDAIRHPFEAKYFQERYAYFYLIAVTTDNEERRSRLIKQQFRSDEIDRLDDKEYPRENNSSNRLQGYDLLVSQDIQSVIEGADIYLFNQDNESNKTSPPDLKRQIIRYVSLMMHPGLITPTSEERCMQAAFTAKLNSGCISRQVGAVVADKNFSIKAIGWNDVPRGQVPCSLRNVRHLFTGQDKIAYSQYETSEEFKDHIKSKPIGIQSSQHFEGRNLSYCFKSNYNAITSKPNQVHTRSLHAEENAFLQLATGSGQVSEKGYLFTTASPCELCAKKAFQLGIQKIFFIDPYPEISRNHVLASGKEDSRPKLIQFQGAIGKTYHQLFSPIMPIKDELDFLIPSQS